ncbi:MAG: hypothetical protein ABR972_13660, partial [Acidimicrobiales bacterium]
SCLCLFYTRRVAGTVDNRAAASPPADGHSTSRAGRLHPGVAATYVIIEDLAAVLSEAADPVLGQLRIGAK